MHTTIVYAKVPFGWLTRACDIQIQWAGTNTNFQPITHWNTIVTRVYVRRATRSTRLNHAYFPKGIMTQSIVVCALPIVSSNRDYYIHEHENLKVRRKERWMKKKDISTACRPTIQTKQLYRHFHDDASVRKRYGWHIGDVLQRRKTQIKTHQSVNYVRHVMQLRPIRNVLVLAIY